MKLSQEGFEKGNSSINRKFKNFQKFSDPSGEERKVIFPHGIYEAQSFVFNTSDGVFFYNKKNL